MKPGKRACTFYAPKREDEPLINCGTCMSWMWDEACCSIQDIVAHDGNTVPLKSGINEADQVIPGIYRQFNGAVYSVIGVAKGTDHFGDVVVYMSKDTGTLCVRDVAEFLAPVVVDGSVIPRFTRVNNTAVS